MWAKVCGNYCNIEAGSPSEAFTLFTGAPTKHFYTLVYIFNYF